MHLQTKLITSLKNSHGMSLLGVVISIGILGIVITGTTNLISQVITAQSTQRFHTELETFNEELRANLSSKTACLNSFTGIQLNNSTDHSLDDIKNETGATFANKVNAVGDNIIHIDSIQLVGTNTPGLGALNLRYRTDLKVYGNSQLQRTIRIQATLDSSDNIIECLSLSKMTDGIWRYDKDNVSDVYFNGGNVGIGTSTPTEKLHVDGETRTETLSFPDGRVQTSAPGNCRVRTRSRTNSAASNNVGVTCSAGEFVSSGGCRSSHWGCRFWVNSPAGNGWTCGCHLYPLSASAKTVTAYAICCRP